MTSAPRSLRALLRRDPEFMAAAKRALQELVRSPPGPIETFIQQGGRFPIAVLAANRPEMLERTLSDLLVRNVAAATNASPGAVGGSGSGGGGDSSGGRGAAAPEAPAVAVRRAKASDVIVLQDGTNQEVATVARKFLGVGPTQNLMFETNLR